MSSDPTPYGNLILSRFPIIERQNFSLPRMNAGEQRGVIVAEIQLPNRDQHLTFMATHLDHRRPADERLASAVFINKLVNEVRGPALLAGDLNDTFDSPTLDELEKSWKHVTEHPLATIPVSQPSRQIDFILYRPQHNWTVVETRVLDEATASDHRAIVTELVLPNL
jgi:endonuclease/exonuclease/phosphatase family metal-dependent hydrolase